jgi:DNA (cytosine-5)-methyltransferase 1
MAKPLPRVVSLYSGAGGLDQGFIEAGFDIFWANDFDGYAVESYNHNIGDHAVYGPIEEQTWPQRGSADVVIGGPSCQGFSQAGKMDPHDPRSRHVHIFFDVVEHIQPQAFVMENVKNLAVSSRFELVRESLFARARELGYTTSLFLLNASHFEVPQARERMFLVGVRSRAPLAPTPISANSPPSVRSALETLPAIGEPGNDSLCSAIITTAKNPVLRRSPFAGMLFNGQGRPLDLEAPALTLPASMGGNRTPIIDQQTLEDGSEPWVVGYHRHLWEGGAPYASTPSRLRRISVQEAMVLQTFPRTWVLAGKQSVQYRQIGNAVPTRLSYHVASALRKTLD